MTEKLLTSLKALIVTDWEEMDWDGIPDIIPEVRLRESPIGRDPEVTENDRFSPSMTGDTEKYSPKAIVKRDEE